MTVKQRWEQAKAKYEDAKDAYNMSEGVLRELKKEAKTVWHCDSVSDLKKLLKQMTAEATKAEQQAEEALDEFEAAWQERESVSESD